MIDRETIMTWLKKCGNGGCSSRCPYDDLGPDKCYETLMTDSLELLKHDEQTIESLERTIDKLTKALAEQSEQSQWHPFNPVEPDTDGLEDHNFYLVTVKGFGTPMKAMYHIDMPFGFTPPPTKGFDPYDVIAWCELPDNMDEEVK